MIKTKNYPEHKFSKLFIDFTKKQGYITEIFKSEIELKNTAYLTRIAQNDNRNALQTIIEDTCKIIELTELQKYNLKNLGNSNTLAIVTGQQIGFMGGPLYTILKLQSAVNKSKELSNQIVDFDFVPIFWIEDNDHDKLEASKTHIFDFNNSIHKIQPAFPNDKTMCGAVKYDESINENINQVQEILKNFKYKDDFLEIIENSYSEGMNWTDAFVKFLNYFFKDDGVLFVSAKKAVDSGVFADLIKKEIENYQKSFEIIRSSSENLLNNSYHQQVIPSELNLFFHINSERMNFLNEINNHQNINDFSLYSPKALLRPIFQDYLIPNAAYIAGPGEVAYFSQIADLYKFFEVEMPVLLPRHSVVFINKKIQKLLEIDNLEIEYFENEIKHIEKDIAELNSDAEFIDLIDQSKLMQKVIFDSIKEKLISFDKQLSQSCDTALLKANEQIEFLQKKSITAIKRLNSDKIQKYSAAKNYLFPENNFQERFFCVGSFVAEFSLFEFKKIVENICNYDPNSFIEYYLE